MRELIQIRYFVLYKRGDCFSGFAILEQSPFKKIQMFDSKKDLIRIFKIRNKFDKNLVIVWYLIEKGSYSIL